MAIEQLGFLSVPDLPIWSSKRSRRNHFHFRAFGSGAVTTRFDLKNLCLSHPGFEYQPSASEANVLTDYTTATEVCKKNTWILYLCLFFILIVSQNFYPNLNVGVDNIGNWLTHSLKNNCKLKTLPSIIVVKVSFI